MDHWMARPTSMLTSLSVPFSPSPPRYACWHAGNGRRFPPAWYKQVAAGYVVYGSSTMLVYTPDAVFTPLLMILRWVFSACAGTDALPGERQNLLHQRRKLLKFPNGVKKYIKFCQEEDKSPTARIPHVISVHWSRISTVTAERRYLSLPKHRQPPGR